MSCSTIGNSCAERFDFGGERAEAGGELHHRGGEFLAAVAGVAIEISFSCFCPRRANLLDVIPRIAMQEIRRAFQQCVETDPREDFAAVTIGLDGRRLQRGHDEQARAGRVVKTPTSLRRLHGKVLGPAVNNLSIARQILKRVLVKPRIFGQLALGQKVHAFGQDGRRAARSPNSASPAVICSGTVCMGR